MTWQGVRTLQVLPGLLAAAALAVTTLSCQREPWLELVDPNAPVEFQTDRVVLDLDVLWDYDLVYDWQAEWWYGWDGRDDTLFGTWNLQEPTTFNIRRYFTDQDPTAPHTSVVKDQVTGNRFRSRYRYGFYDVMVWNDVYTLDGVQSLHYDESTSLEYVTAYTNQASHSTSVPHHAPAASSPYKVGYAFYQPEFLFAGNYDDLYVSHDPADYDSLDVETNTWVKHVPICLTPVTYIYLTQVVLHHNRNRIAGVEGNANITGMARSVNMHSHITSTQDISVSYFVRLKRHLPFVSRDGIPDDDVDIVGGRAFTFGLTGVNPYAVSRSHNYSQVAQSVVPNYLEVNLLFNNGMDSTFVFDVTSQVKERYKGGVITVELDVDSVPIPSRSGGSGFDAVVKDFEEEEYEFDM